MIRSLLLCLWAFVAFVFGPCLPYAVTHPVRITQNSNCAECHTDRASGAFVHPALKRGCAVCHLVSNQDGFTDVDSARIGAAVCRECHPPPVLLHGHFPYTSGMCLRCHDPHASSNPKLLRAKVNELCLDCHLQTAKRRSSTYLPTIELVANNTAGHPYARHPVSGGYDPLRGGEMSCVSCHLAHGGTKVHHLRMGAEIPEDALNQNTETKDMCEKCHLRLWGQTEEGPGKHRRRKN
jgi:predicted CXXCH cytochrome family protein